MRYYEDWNRERAHENQKEHGYVYTIEQIRDICNLVKTDRIPDGTYGDTECILWEVLKEYFGK
jgi:hypothetical protein